LQKNCNNMALRKKPTASGRDNKKKSGSFGGSKPYGAAAKRGGDKPAGKGKFGFKKAGGDDRKPPRKYSTSSRSTDSKPAYKPRRDDASEGKRPAKKYSSSRGGEDTKKPFRKDKAEYGKGKPTRAYSTGNSRNTDTRKSSFKPREEREEREDRRPQLNRFSKPEDTKRSYGFKKEESRGDDREKRPASSFSKTSGTKSFSRNREEKGENTKRPTRSYEPKSYGFKKEDSREDGREKRPTTRFSKTSDNIKPYSRKKEEGDAKRPVRSSEPKSFSKTGFKRADKRDDARPSFGDKKEYKKTSRKPFDLREEKRARKKEEESEEEGFLNENVRLNRYISNAGICSRREADKLISTGLVSVNGTIITEMGYQVKSSDDVRFNGQRLSREKKVYIIMNKPKDAITTLDDPDGRNTVMDVLGNDLRERVFPVGRLDRNTTGVLILTNDGELSQRLMHPKYEVEKVYKATLNQVFKGEDFWQMTNGLELEDGFIKPDEIAYPNPKTKMEVGVQIHSGRNRIIHRMFEHLGYLVDKLDRVSYGGFVKTGMKRGEWRILNDKEIKKLKRMVKLA
jgi:23S rRNA pseudouridine2605 synthase